MGRLWVGGVVLLGGADAGVGVDAVDGGVVLDGFAVYFALVYAFGDEGDLEFVEGFDQGAFVAFLNVREEFDEQGEQLIGFLLHLLFIIREKIYYYKWY